MINLRALIAPSKIECNIFGKNLANHNMKMVILFSCYTFRFRLSKIGNSKSIFMASKYSLSWNLWSTKNLVKKTISTDRRGNHKLHKNQKSKKLTSVSIIIMSLDSFVEKWTINIFVKLKLFNLRITKKLFILKNVAH